MNCLKVPCPQCPFTKKSLKGYFGGVYESPVELHTIVMNEKPFPCHVAQGDNDVPWNKVGTEQFPLCAGALLYMKKGCKSPRDLRLNEAMKSVDTSQMDQILSVPEFIAHHEII